jgi:phage terminase large subunit-like protein
MTERVTVESLLSSVPDEVWALPDKQLSTALREGCRYDPLLFALWYLGHHIADPVSGTVSFAPFHVELARRALSWTRGRPGPAEHRHADVAPRESGKSTWKFLILPLWAAAYGHVKFVAAFADSGPQAEMHLATFKRELADNPRLIQDFPMLTTPGKLRNVSDSDTKGMYIASDQFVFAARGIDAKTLGMKVGARRPDLILLDDIEPQEATYSLYQKDQRLSALLNAVLPLSITARVELSGTVTMPGSIVHDLIRTQTHPNDEQAEWVSESNFQVHHHLPLIDDGEGGEVSMWEEKWSTEFLLSIRHTRQFSLNYANDPMAVQGAYWSREDFSFGSTFTAERTILVLDPAVTTKEKSDFTGVAVVAGNRALGRCRVEHAAQVKLPPGEPLRQYCLRMLDTYPEIGGILVETNQGGDVWKVSVLHDMPVKVATDWSDDPKETRAADLLAHYQRGRVEHARQLATAQGQMISFPRGAHDDIVDAIGSGVRHFLPKGGPRRRSTSSAYAGR